MSRTLVFILGLIAASILAYFCISQHIQTIPADIKARTFDELSDSGLGAVGVSMDGRDVVLSGIVETDEAKLNAEKRALTVEGVRRIDNRIIVVPPVQPEPVEVVQAITSEHEIAEENNKCEQNLTDIMSKHTILFAFGSANIDDKSTSLLDNIADIAKTCPKSKIIVNGYTDNVGSDTANQNVSQKRAQSVADYLSNKSGLTQEIKAVGHGEANPIDSNDTSEGRAKNRRIEFNVLPIE